jgi:hypothetical protein
MALPMLLSAVFASPPAAQAADPAPPSPASTAPAAAKTIAPADDISTPARGAKKPTPASAVKAEPSDAKDRLLWDHWYTVTVGKDTRYEYYNDRAELKKGRVVFQNHAWKKEDDFINEEQLGAFAKDDAQLTPLFFNFHSTYRSVETHIDGNITDQSGGGRMLSVRVRKGTTESAPIKKMVSPKTFFSSHFPVWLGKNLATLKPGQLHSIQTILEDNLEAEFTTVHGQVRIEPADEIARKTGSTKLMVNYNDVRSYWWVGKNGAPERIELPHQKTVVQRVTQEAAQKFLASGD